MPWCDGCCEKRALEVCGCGWAVCKSCRMTCESCDQVVCLTNCGSSDGEPKTCDGCAAKVCNKCAVDCSSSICDNTFCQGCRPRRLPQCASCQERSCCMDESKCGAKVCFDCVKECAYCMNTVCPSVCGACAVQCGRCHQVICLSCLPDDAKYASCNQCQHLSHGARSARARANVQLLVDRVIACLRVRPALIAWRQRSQLGPGEFGHDGLGSRRHGQTSAYGPDGHARKRDREAFEADQEMPHEQEAEDADAELTEPAAVLTTPDKAIISAQAAAANAAQKRFEGERKAAEKREWYAANDPANAWHGP